MGWIETSLFDFTLALSPRYPGFPRYSTKHKLSFTHTRTAMISDLLAVTPINNQLGCQTVTPCCCNDLFHTRDLIHDEERRK